MRSDENEESHTIPSLSLEHAQLGSDKPKDNGTPISAIQEEGKGEADNPTCCRGKVDSSMSQSVQSSTARS